MSNNEIVFLFTYKTALGKEAHMAIYGTDRKKAYNDFLANKEATDRLISETHLTPEQYRNWKKEI